MGISNQLILNRIEHCQSYIVVGALQPFARHLNPKRRRWTFM